MNSMLIKDWVQSVEEYIPGKIEEGKIKLSSNENNFGPSPYVKKVLKDKIDEINVYPHRDKQLREKIADYCKEDVSAENIVVGNGSDELIELILKGFKSPALMPNPTFGSYRISCQMLGESYLTVRLNEDFSLPVEKYRKEAEKANIIFFCNPNNPTGSVVKKQDVESILDTGKLVVVDEAYYEFYGESMASLLEEYDNLIVLRTFSKAFALGGLRIGYGVTSKKIASVLRTLRQPFSVNTMAEIAAIAALEDQEYMRDCVEKIIRERERIYKALDEKFNAFESEANFVLADTSPVSSQKVYEKLYENDIIVRRFGKFKDIPGDYIRVTVGKPEENDMFIQALDGLQF